MFCIGIQPFRWLQVSSHSGHCQDFEQLDVHVVVHVHGAVQHEPVLVPVLVLLIAVVAGVVAVLELGTLDTPFSF